MGSFDKRYLVLSVFTLVLVFSIYFVGYGIYLTGFATYEQTEYKNVSLISATVPGTTYIPLIDYNLTNVTSLVINGLAYGTGDVLVYVNTTDGAYLLYSKNLDSNSSTNSITGFVVSDNTDNSSNASIASDATDNSTTNETITITDNLTDNSAANSDSTINLTDNISTNQSENITVNLTENVTANFTENITSNFAENISMNITENSTVNLSTNVTENSTPNISENLSTSMTGGEGSNEIAPSNSTVSDTSNASNTTMPSTTIYSVILDGSCINSCTLPRVDVVGLTIIADNASVNISGLSYSYIESLFVNISQTKSFNGTVLAMNVSGNATLDLNQYFAGQNIIYDATSSPGYTTNIRNGVMTVNGLIAGDWNIMVYAVSNKVLLTSEGFTVRVINNTFNQTLNNTRLARIIRLGKFSDNAKKTHLEQKLGLTGKKTGLGVKSNGKDKSLKINDVLVEELLFENDSGNYTVNGSTSVNISDVNDQNSMVIEGLNSVDDINALQIKDSIITPIVYVQSLNITNATITLQKYGPVNQILTCGDSDYDVNTGNCLNWQSSGVGFIDNGNSITFTVNHFSAYTGGGGNKSQMNISDDTDTLTRFTKQQIVFVANYTNTTSGISINSTSVYCQIAFNTTGTYTSYSNMTFNTSTLLYNYNSSFGANGTYYFNVLCNGTALGYEILNATDNFTVNRGCMDLNTSGSTETLTQNVSVNGSTCFTISAQNVTLDCAGYSILGNRADGTSGVYSNSGYNLIVKNCVIDQFNYGVYVLSGVNNVTITNNTIRTGSTASNCYSILSLASNVTLTYNNVNLTAYSSPGCGYGDYGISPQGINNFVAYNNVTGNGIDALTLDYGTNTYASNNTISVGANTYPIHLYYGNNITIINHNINVTTNSGQLIYSYSVTNVFIINNTFTNNGAGGILLMSQPTGILLDNNAFIKSYPTSAISIFGSYSSQSSINITTSNTINGKRIFYYGGVSLPCPNNQVLSFNGTDGNISELRFVGCNNVTVQDWNINTSNDGLHLVSTNLSTIANNVISNASMTVSLEAANNISVFNNTLEPAPNNWNYGYGISLVNAGSDLPSGNLIYNNTIISFGTGGGSSDYMVNLYGSNNRLSYNTINFSTPDCGETGVVVSSPNNTIEYNTIINSCSSGAIYSYVDNTTIVGNSIFSIYYHRGIYLSGAKNCIVSNNTIQVNTTITNGYGLLLEGTKNDQITNNNITIYGNNGAGVNLYSSSLNNTIIGGVVNSNSTTGMLVASSAKNNTIRNVTIFSSTTHLSADATTANNLFYWNNFNGTGVWISNSNETNQFNTTVNGVPQGNFYLNITGYDISDTNLDGWGDAGSQYPVNATTTSSKWSGLGSDYGPATNKFGCGTLSTPNNVLTLPKNMSINGSTCFTISAQNVTLDCAGYSIIGNNTVGTYGVYSNQYNTTIRNCDIRWFGNSANPGGIYFSGVNVGQVYNDVITTNNSMPIDIETSGNITINNVTLYSTISGCSQRSVYLGSSSNVTLSNSTIYNNCSNNAILINGGSSNAILSNNMILSSSSGVGLANNANNIVRNNQITNNGAGGEGIYFQSNSNYNIVDNNTISVPSATGYAVYIDGSSSNNITSGVIIASNGIITGTTRSSGNLIRNVTINASVCHINMSTVSNNTLIYYNNFTGSGVWVDNSNSTNMFNTSVGGVAQGNYYSGIIAFDINDNNFDGWGDAGSQYPLNSSNVPSKWFGLGADYGPATTRFVCGNLAITNHIYTLTQNLTINGSTCFTVTAQNVTLDCAGYSIIGDNTGATYGVNSDQFGTTVKNCGIIGFSYGIYYYNTAKNGTIINNYINTTRSSAPAILFLNGANYTNVTNNSMVTSGDSSYGIYLANSGGSIFSNNNVTTSYMNSYGAFLPSGSNNNIFSNNNIVAPRFRALYLNGASNNIFTNNNFTAGDPTWGSYDVVYLYGASNNSFMNNYIALYNSGSSGFSIDAGSYGDNIWNNTISIVSSTIINHGFGFYLLGGSYGNNIWNNKINSTVKNTGGFYGIYLHGSSGNNLTNNFVFFNMSSSVGVFSDSSSSNNTVTGGNLTAAYSIYIASSSYNNTFSNITMNATTTHVYADASSSYNMFYYNNIIGNGTWVNDSNSTNMFNTTVNGFPQGNFYSNILAYNITDSDGDGFGDSGTQYPVNATNAPSYWFGLGADYGPATTKSFCNMSFTSGQTLVLNNSVTVHGQSCFNVNAQNVTIDCNGYSITGDDTSSYGIYSNQYGTSVKNCTVSGFAYAMYFTGVSNGLIDHSTLSSDMSSVGYYTVYLNSGNNITLQYSNITENGHYGFALYINNVNNGFIKNNTVMQNGVQNPVTITGQNNTLIGNSVTYNGGSATSIINTGSNSIVIKNNYISSSNALGGTTYLSISNNPGSIIDGNNINMTSGNWGIFSSSPNSVIQNNIVTESVSSGFSASIGISPSSSGNLNITVVNNTINGQCPSNGYGLYLSNYNFNVNNINVINNSINLSNGYGIYIEGQYYDYNISSFLQGNTIIVGSNNAIYNHGAPGAIIFADMQLSPGYTVQSTFIAHPINMTFLNVSFNRNNLIFSGGNIINNSLSIEWYLDAYVNNSFDGSPLPNAQVNVTDVNNNNVFSGLTDVTGYITRQNITETVLGSTSNLTFNNYTINVTTGSKNSKSVNITNNTLLILNTLYGYCINITRPNANFPFYNNIAINSSTCFTITAQNITLNCNNYSITGNNTPNTYGAYSSQYFYTAINCSNIYNFTDKIEQPATTGNVSTPNRLINDKLNGVPYNFMYNVIVNNTGNSTMRNLSVLEYSQTANIQSMSVYINNCTADFKQNNTCYVTFNITTIPNLPISQMPAATFIINWSNNNGTNISFTQGFDMIIQGNPQLSLSSYNINITDNIGRSNTTLLNVESIGTVDLGQLGNQPNSVFINLVSSDIPASWVKYVSTYPYWDVTCGSNCWDILYISDPTDLTVNVTVGNYTPYTYTGKINITSYSGGVLQRYDEINLTINVAPSMTTNPASITYPVGISTPQSTLIAVQDNGNAPVTNATVAFVSANIPQSWISFSSNSTRWNSTTNSWSRIDEHTNTSLNFTLTVQNFTSYNYTGYINITSVEGITAIVNVSINVNPQLGANNISQAMGHGTTSIQQLAVNATGNAKVINITASYINSTLPSSWITLSYNGSNGQSITIGDIIESNIKNINVTINVPAFQDPGIYTGLIDLNANNFGPLLTNITINVSTNSSWNIVPPVNKSNTFTLNQGGTIANIIVNNTGNIPVNFSINYNIQYNAGGDICYDYYCLGSPPPAGSNPTSIYVQKNSTGTVSVYTVATTQSKVNVGVEVNFSNGTATPNLLTSIMVFNVTNMPPILVSLNTSPSNYTERNKGLNIQAIITDDEPAGPTTGMNFSAVYFNVTDLQGNLFHVGNNSVDMSNVSLLGAPDRKKFNYTFFNTSIEGTYNITIYITDKSGNVIAPNLYQFQVIGYTNISILSAQNAVSNNVTILHGDMTNASINVNVSGFVTAYDINITAITAQPFTISTTNLGNLSTGQNITGAINITVPSGTLPGLYALTSIVSWQNPNGSIANATGPSFNLNVTSNPELTSVNSQSLSLNHASNATLDVLINSTGNANYGDAINPAIITFSSGSIPNGWVSFDNSLALLTKTLGILNKNTTKNVTAYFAIPRGAPPGVYTGIFNTSSASYNSTKSTLINLSLTILLDANSWNYTVTYTKLNFSLNEPGIFGIINISNSGNGNLTFNMTYTNFGQTNYSDYHGLFNTSQNVSGTIMNNNNLTVVSASVQSLYLYYNGWTSGLTNVGINVTVATSINNQSTPFMFNITDYPPQITNILFYNNSNAQNYNYTELSRPITLKTLTGDDAGVNTATLTFNITTPNGTIITLQGLPTGENHTLYGQYVLMNFTQLFNQTGTPGVYNVTATVSDVINQYTTSNRYSFTVLAKTNLLLIPSNNTYNASNITLTQVQNLSIPILFNNTGLVNAYNVTLTANMTGNNSAWTANALSYSLINSQNSTNAQLTIGIPADTTPGQYNLTLIISWVNPDGTSSSYVYGIVTVNVDSNKVIKFSNYNSNITLKHGTTNITTIELDSVGNDDASNVIIYILNAPTNITVSATPVSMSSILKNTSRIINLSVSPVLGLANGTYAFDVKVRNDGKLSYSDNYTELVNIPANYDWTMTKGNTTLYAGSNITINGVSSQNQQNTELVVTSYANAPITFNNILTGVIRDAGMMNILNPTYTLQPLHSYSIILNHTAPVANNNYTGILTVDDGASSLVDINIQYSSHIANITINNITPYYNLVSGDMIKINSTTIYENNPITNNITLTALIDNSPCIINTTTINGSNIITNCIVPQIADGSYHNVTLTANYSTPLDIIAISQTSNNALFYKDLTNPVVNALSIGGVENGTNITISANVTDNYAVDKVIAQVTTPSGTVKNFTLPNTGNSIYAITLNTSINLSEFGLYDVLYIANDTTNNINNTVHSTFEVYGLRTYSGTLKDLNNIPFQINFTLKSQVGNISFASNSSGYYNFTIYARVYNITMMFPTYNITIYNVPFYNLQSFLTMDRIASSDVSSQLAGSIRGFVVDTNMPVNAAIVIDFSNDSVTSKDNLRVYQCAGWNYTTRACTGIWWQQLNNQVDKITNLVSATSTTFSNTTSAFVLSEIPSNPMPVINLPINTMSLTINHSGTGNGLLQIQSVGTAPLSNIYSTCTLGTLCSGFNVATTNISIIPVGTFAYMNVSVRVPAFQDPGLYTGIMTIIAGTAADTFNLNVNVPSLTSYNYSIDTNYQDVGSSTIGTFATLRINNTGNAPLTINIMSSSTNVTFSQNNFTTISKDTYEDIPVYYTAPGSIGTYSYNITINNPVLGNRTINLTLNVSHQATISSITPNQNISANDTITIKANAQSGLTYIANNVNWSVSINGTTCTGLSSTYSILQGLWVITCNAPQVPDRTNHDVKLQGYFDGKYSYDTGTIIYRDIFPPSIINVTDSSVETGGTIQVNATAIDDNNITGASVSMVSPSGATLTPLVTLVNKTIISEYALTELGDYNISYNVSDIYGNSMVTSDLFEVYQPEIFSGKVVNGQGNGVSNITFQLYRRNNDMTEQFTTGNDGSYFATIRNRTYVQMGINAFNANILLDNVDVGSHANQFNIQSVNTSTLSIADTSSVVSGIAVNTTINTTGRVTFTYTGLYSGNPSTLKVYKCSNWSYANNSCSQIYWNFIPSTLGLGYVNFNITGFSAYVLAAAATPAYVVGDGICSVNAGESYANSPNDCPPSSTSTTTTTTTTISSSSGGGGGGSTTTYNNGIDASTLRDTLTSILNQGSGVSLDTSSISRDMYPGEFANTTISLKNKLNKSVSVRVTLSGSVTDMVSIPTPFQDINSGDTAKANIRFGIPLDTKPGLYTGEVSIVDNSDNILTKIPIEVRVLEVKDRLLDMKISPLNDRPSPGDTLKIQIDVFNLGTTKRVDLQLKLQLINPDTMQVYSATEESLAIETSLSVIKSLKIPSNIPLGRYIIQGDGSYTNDQLPMVTRSIATVEVVKPWYTYMIAGVIPVWGIVIVIAFILINILLFEWYEKRRAARMKYHVPVDYHSLPIPGPRTAFFGNVAETSIRTFFELDKFQTHTIVAGSTGSGKTIAAQIIVEEALKNNVAVIVYDPTAQWTGFLRKCNERRMLKMYRDFGMTEKEARPFNGNIRTIRNAMEKLSIERLIKPGEITVFDISKLEPSDIDIFVSSTVKQVFDANLEESQQLKLLIVYDEVHRLLPKFGGSGDGFLQIERAVREFRKWGVGILLISQVLSDFVGQIKANINTEIQMKTRDEDDLSRTRVKYGDDFLKILVKSNVGTGMIENSEYNKGRPYFISFRPVLHSVQRLSDEELRKYEEYNSKIDAIEWEISQLKGYDYDIFDLSLELKLASDKLKAGAFNMVDIYLEGIVPRLKNAWEKIGKIPKPFVKELLQPKDLRSGRKGTGGPEDGMDDEGHRLFDRTLLKKSLPTELVIVEEKRDETSLELLQRNSAGLKGLAITRTNPDVLKQKKQFKDIKIYWLSTQTDRQDVISPNMIEQIYEAIINYMNERAGKDSVVLLDGLSAIINNTSFDRTLNLLVHIKDSIAGKNCTVIVPINVDTLKREEKEQLETEFKMINGWRVDGVAKDNSEDVSNDVSKETSENISEAIDNEKRTFDMKTVKDPYTRSSKTAHTTKKDEYDDMQLIDLIDAARSESDIDKLRNMYLKMHSMYKDLSSRDKLEYYQKIKDVFDRLNVIYRNAAKPAATKKKNGKPSKNHNAKHSKNYKTKKILVNKPIKKSNMSKRKNIKSRKK